jgi:hypothetical protein
MYITLITLLNKESKRFIKSIIQQARWPVFLDLIKKKQKNLPINTGLINIEKGSFSYRRKSCLFYYGLLLKHQSAKKTWLYLKKYNPKRKDRTEILSFV